MTSSDERSNEMARFIGRCEATLEDVAELLDAVPLKVRSLTHERVRQAVTQRLSEINEMFPPED